MLKLANITKDYEVADTKVRALKGLNIAFRENEFVSVLGPSGCGKTTLLNIVGGLDRCTSGDLSIFGKSTKEYKDRDWDVYRNHRIGFIFQTYNLIPHQSVLGNVELALTIAGMGKEERTRKAKAALDKVGLSDQYFKKPNQLSGGQCQRVAIARALVNDPEILLADEPTGALDTKTSRQIMDLIKEIAKERLVIMVTHNPELAEEYSTRIIRLLDGELVSDTNPFKEEDEKEKTRAALKRQAERNKAAEAALNGKRMKKENAKMSFFTSFKLSLQNLFTKKRRTIMTAIAGSIGIIGVSLVLSISIGLQGFINNMQNDMLAGNPIEISQSTFDINTLLGGMTNAEKREILEKGNWINVESMIAGLNKRFKDMQDVTVQNNINRDYVTYLKDMPQEYWAALHLDYGLDVGNNIYTSFLYSDPAYPSGRETSLSGIKAVYGSVLEQINGFEEIAPMLGSLSSSFMQAPDTRNPVTEDYVLSQYNVLYSRAGTNGIAKEANEVMIVLGKDRMLADLTLGQIGYYSQDEFVNIANKAIGNLDDFDPAIYDGGKIEYGTITDKPFMWYPNDRVFTQTQVGNIPFTYQPYADAAWNPDGLPLRVVGILEPKEELSYGMLSSGLYYTTALAEYGIARNWNSELAKFLRDTEKSDTLSGAAMILRKGTEMNMGTESNPNIIILPEDRVQVVSGKVISYDYEYIYGGMAAPETAKGLIGAGSSMMSGFMGILGLGGDRGGVSMVSYSLQQLGGNVEMKKHKDQNDNITAIEVITDANGNAFPLPVNIAVYPPDFAEKDNVLAWLNAWNDESIDILLSDGRVLTPENREKIVYSDMLSLIMGMISSLLQMVTIALVGFTALALVVSCVMIAIITYVSVVERIKEIGVIRSLGGRKRDVSNLFTAETFIIGLSSGLIGILITYLLSLVVNLAVKAAGIAAIANFPWWVALIMVGVSVGLTLISGLMPSKSAAKKDPVVALRTE